MGHKGCLLMEWPMSFHQLLWRSAWVSLHIHQKPFVRYKQLGRQRVGLSTLCHCVGQGCECIWAKPASHQPWKSGAGEPASDLHHHVQYISFHIKKPSMLHVIYYLYTWMDNRVDSPACFACNSGSTRELWIWWVLPVRLGLYLPSSTWTGVTGILVIWVFLNICS